MPELGFQTKLSLPYEQALEKVRAACEEYEDLKKAIAAKKLP